REVGGSDRYGIVACDSTHAPIPLRARSLGRLIRQEAVAVASRSRRREARVRDAAVLRVLGRGRVVAGGGLVRAVEAPRAVRLELPRARAEEHARTLTGADECVPRLRRAVHEVPLRQPALLPLDDQQRLAGEDEEVL